MGDVAHKLQSEFWHAALPVDVDDQTLPLHSEVVELPACLRCGTEFIMDSRFCYSCGAKRRDAIVDGEASRDWHEMFSATLDRVQALPRIFANVATQVFSVFPAFVAAISLPTLRRQAGLGVASFSAFAIGVGCCIVAAVLVFSGTHEPGSMMLAAHLERIEWLLGGTSAFAAGLLLKGRSRRD